LELVVNGNLTREEVSDWASLYIMAVEPTIEDENVWDLLILISGIDIRDSAISYLHNEEDSKAWIERAKALE
jgi:hypothetical protein